MSKHVRDLLFEFEVQSEIEEHFRLHVLKVTLNENDEAEEFGNALPVTKIEIDSESEECLLHFDEQSTDYVTIAEAKTILVDSVLGYEVFAAEEKELDDAHVRLDTPLIGFGENAELKCFFVVCQAE
ncbi:MAG: hypothetical protein KBT75_01255 [Oleispira antarctica]|nr:hypothetical protein [Oleispira antarctica]MBQ0794055.1 hypothetical protein [Oleispira antarctica]